MRLVLFVLVVTAACQAPAGRPLDSGSADAGPQTLDLRADFPAAPVDGGVEIRVPDIEVGPYSEVLLCYYGTWTGPTVGVNHMSPLGPVGVTHHNQMKAVYGDDYEDGALVPCPDVGGEMPTYAPLFESVGVFMPGGKAPDTEMYGGLNWLQMPEGIAFQLREGQRWVLDIHFVNPTDDTLIVNAGVNLGTLPVEEVEHFAGSVQFDAGDLTIPAGGATVAQFRCDWREPLTVLSILGHMHDAGAAYTVDHERDGQAPARVYEVLDWTPAHREYPLIENYAPGELTVLPGDGFRTLCAWDNQGTSDLTFPREMCTTVVVAYPLDEPLTCINGVYEDHGGPPPG